jgi:hypothetical protein
VRGPRSVYRMGVGARITAAARIDLLDVGS